VRGIDPVYEDHPPVGEIELRRRCRPFDGNADAEERAKSE